MKYGDKDVCIKSKLYALLACSLICFLPALAVAPKAKQVPVKVNNSPGSQVFLNGLRARILHNWLAPDGKNVVVLEVTVGSDGQVSNVSTANSKADSLAIAAAAAAFEKAQPMGALPPGYTGTCKITLTFTSNVDPHGDSTSNLTSRIEQISQSLPTTSTEHK